MAQTSVRKTGRVSPMEEQQRLDGLRAQIREELPDLIEKDRMRKQAAKEDSLSGHVRRAIHARGETLDDIARKVGVTALAIDEFLTGEQPLSSDVLDRVVGALGLRLQSTSETLR